jgi:cytochrome c553
MHIRTGSRLSATLLLRVVSLTTVILAAGISAGCRQDSTDLAGKTVDPPAEAGVTAVQGPSWLGQLGSSLAETSMGKMGGSGGPPPSQLRSEPDLVGELSEGEVEGTQLLREPFVLTGSDLYRIDCRSCHGVNGQGAPPEIASLIPIVSALRALPGEQAFEGLQRFLEKPGPKMPPYHGLQQDEIQALLTHLESLSSPGSSSFPEKTVRESGARVGEHVVKGTCHICHAATGPGEGSMPMMSGTVPSLASFARSYRLEALENAVRYGASGMMGMMGGTTRLMPPLPYLTSQEVAAAYLYLAAYPPEP